ncbi:MAG: phenylalanine--tRNA ligase beta subunit-related protein [Carboxylicivirga sp.]|jgi:DNA/RNA-binding domain of Phe-tRNA-synthetase-like protein|nr:phenylalanine--tRNA ligase beta subunit-related protein [Carboxylicivirga sp.]MCT4643772.1 phenylalanine--tRNA ligase beta subunit-related protein [Carboxylicivirga sp.]
MNITIDTKLKTTLPDLLLGGFIVDVKVNEPQPELLTLLDDEVNKLEQIHTPETIREMATVKANKNAYRALGKDPNRYRPAAEALLRRVANGKGLYHINNVVDILNLISVKTGFSICGYNYDAIEGDVTMGIGEEKEPYQGIGRGDVNIEKLPVFRDDKGAFGNPTSDSTRTMVTENTQKFLFLIIGFEGKELINKALDEAVDLLQQFAEGKEAERFFVE